MFEWFPTFITDDDAASVCVFLVLNARGVVCKSLATVRADVRPLACVNSEVYFDPIPGLEDFVTVRTGESHITVHCIYVVPQVALTRKLLRAVLANNTVFYFTFPLRIIRFLCSLVNFCFNVEIHSVNEKNIIKKGKFCSADAARLSNWVKIWQRMRECRYAHSTYFVKGNVNLYWQLYIH